jgi:hypothetical protein
MNAGTKSAIIRGSRMAYSGLLMCYPRELRRRFGAEMTDLFETVLREAVVERGAAGIASSWGLALWELLTVAVPLRLTSNAVIAGALSFLVSSTLFLLFFQAAQ